MKKFLFVLILAVVFVPVAHASEKSSLNPILKPFQLDADIYRLRHLKYYSTLIEEYFDKVGKLPFQGEQRVPVTVFVYNSAQKKYARDDNPNPHKMYSVKSFVGRLEEGLGRSIDEYYDPQYVPYAKPNFYIYMVAGDTYFFAVHLSQDYGFATKIAKNYYKVEVTNNPIPGGRAVSLKTLLANAKFQAAANATPSKEGFFEERAAKYLNETKN